MCEDHDHLEHIVRASIASEEYNVRLRPEESQRKQALEVEGQSPHTLVIECIDSRFSAYTMLGFEDGEALQATSPGALVPAYDLCQKKPSSLGATLEMAVQVLGVSTIYVVGHNQCGLAQLLLQGVAKAEEGFLREWANLALGPYQTFRDGGLDAETHDSYLEQAVVLLSVRNLLTYPWVRSRVAEGKLTILPLYCRIGSGQLYEFDHNSGRFEIFMANRSRDAVEASDYERFLQRIAGK